MSKLEKQLEFNRIYRSKTFNVAAFVTAYTFDRRQDDEPYWEKYSFSQIFMVLDGKGTFTTETISFPVEAGMMFYRPANQWSCYEWNSEKVKFALISFVCDSSAMQIFEAHPIRLHEEESTTLLDVIKTAERICEPIKDSETYIGMQVKDNIPDAVLSFIYASLERFLAMVYCRMQKIDLLLDESQKVSRYIEENETVASVKQYLADNLHRQLSLKEICTNIGICQTALMKKFRKETNQGVMEYFTNMKIEQAKRMLQKTSNTVSNVAEALGYSSVNYFTKVFKSKTGLTPTQYSKHASKRRATIGNY